MTVDLYYKSMKAWSKSSPAPVTPHAAPRKRAADETLTPPAVPKREVPDAPPTPMRAQTPQDTSAVIPPVPQAAPRPPPMPMLAVELKPPFQNTASIVGMEINPLGQAVVRNRTCEL
jgi:hypothetical protein